MNTISKWRDHGLAAILFGLFMIVQPAIAQDNATIRKPVTELHEALLENMKQGEEQSFQARYDRLAPVIEQNFNTALIVKVILGRYWATLSEQQQADFIELFNQHTITTYAHRFDSYNGHSFNDVTIEPMKRERYLVKTELAATGEETVSLDYIVQQDEDTWKIISVIANGVNDLSLKRAEYGAVIKDRGFESLIEDIGTKIEEMKAD